MTNIDLAETNADLYGEIGDLKQQIVELKAMNIVNFLYKNKRDNLIEKEVLNEDRKRIIKL